MKVRIEPLTEWNDDVAAVADRMREADKAEVMALSMREPREALARSLRFSGDNYIAYLDDAPVAVFGTYSPALSGFAVPWLLGTDEVTEHPQAYMRLAFRYVRHLREKYAEMSNVVHDDNEPSKRFLSALGFAMSEPQTLANGAVVRVFSLRGI